MGVTAKGPVTNGGEQAVDVQVPYDVEVQIRGVADILFHRWNCEAVAGKAGAAKGSKEKKTDNIESYLYRDDDGYICIPGEYVRQSIIHAAKYRQDPRSPRKSAMDLYKAGIVCVTLLAPIGPKRLKEPQYLHQCRVQVQRNGVTRVRPAVQIGWTADIRFSVLLPEYIRPNDLHEVLSQAGKLVGVADFRPTYGRFQVDRFAVV